MKENFNENSNAGLSLFFHCLEQHFNGKIGTLESAFNIYGNVTLQVNTDLEPQVASDDSAAELSGLLQDPHFMV